MGDPTVSERRPGAPLVSGLVCTRDRGELLAPSLRSLAGSLGERGELVVVDASEPPQPGRFDDLACPTTVLVAPRPGKSRQLNLGALAARGEVLVCTDDDCRVDPGWARAMVAPFEEPAVGVVFGPVEGLSGVRGVAGPERLEPGPAPAVTWHYANGAAMAVRRRTLLELGGFDERLGPGAAQHGEEHDLVLRAQEAGWEIRIAGAPPVRHVEWRDEHETRRNLLVYSRGGGAFVGAALRRAPRRWARLALRRARYQARQWRYWRSEGLTYGPATTWWFLRGLGAGLRLAPDRWIELSDGTGPPPGR